MPETEQTKAKAFQQNTNLMHFLNNFEISTEKLQYPYYTIRNDCKDRLQEI